MLKTLISKQMLEFSSSFSYNARKGVNRSKKGTIGYIIFFVILMVVILGGMFTFLSYVLGAALVPVGYGWLYFDIMILIAILLGVFGSVFNTYSSLYKSNDNDLILSLPIPVKDIIFSRLVSVYITGLMYFSVVYLPTMIIYYIFMKASFWSVLGPFVMLIMLSLFVLVLSSGLGWVVAKFSTTLKNKGITRALLALLALAAYYLVYFKAVDAIEELIVNAAILNIQPKGAAKVLYEIGKAAEGSPISLLVVSLVTIALVALNYAILNKSFIKIVTSNKGEKKKKYKQKTAKQNSIAKALLGKEFSFLTSSSTYMLNGGLGALFNIIGAVLLFIKGKDLASPLSALNISSTTLSLYIAGGSCFLYRMNMFTAPAISLEGKNLWLAQSLPVSAKQILDSKRNLHLILSIPSALLLVIAIVISLSINIKDALLLIVFTTAFNIANAQIGLIFNLKLPNFKWTNEASVIKQSMSVLFTMLAGYAYGGLVILSAIFLKKFINVSYLLPIWSILTIIYVFILSSWLKTKGCKIFSNL